MVSRPTWDSYGETEVRNRAVRELEKTDFSDLSTEQQDLVIAATKEGMNDAITMVERFSDTLDSSADDLNHIIYAEVLYNVARVLHGAERSNSYLPHLQRLYEQILPAYQSGFNPSTTPTFQSIDRFVCGIVLRMEGRSIPQQFVVDNMTALVFNEIWNFRKWSFRTRNIAFTIETDGTISGDFPQVTDKFDSMVSQYYHYKDAPGEVLRWVNADQIAYQQAIWTGRTGRPRYFTMQDEGATVGKTVLFVPQADQQYVCYASVAVEVPDLPTDRTSTSGFDRLPKDFRPLLYYKVAAEVAKYHVKTDGDRSTLASLFRSYNTIMQNKTTEYDDLGRLGVDVRVRDVYGDVGMLTDWGGVI